MSNFSLDSSSTPSNPVERNTGAFPRFRFKPFNNYEQVKSYLNWYLDFKDTELRNSYRNFLLVQKIGSPFIAVCGIVVAIALIPITLAILAGELRTSIATDYFIVRVLIAALNFFDAIFAFFAGCMLFRKRSKQPHWDEDREKDRAPRSSEALTHDQFVFVAFFRRSVASLLEFVSVAVERAFVRIFSVCRLLSPSEHQDLLRIPSLLRDIQNGRAGRDHERLSLAEDFFSSGGGGGGKETLYYAAAELDLEKGLRPRPAAARETAEKSPSKTNELQACLDRAQSRFDFLVSMLYIHSMQFLLIFYYIRRSYSLNCYMTPSPLTQMFGYGKCFSGRDMATSTGVAGMFMLTHCLFLSITIPETPIGVVWWLLGVSFACSVPVLFIQNIEDVAGAWILFALLNAFAIFETQLNSVMIFLSNRRLCAAVDEAERMSEVNRTHETTHILSSLAAELRKPLSLLSSSVDHAEHCLSEYVVSSRHDLSRDEKLSSLTSQLQSSLVASTSAKNSLQMTVHQCIDFMKASKGLRLAPLLDSMNLEKALAVPIATFQALQRGLRAELTLSPSSQLCPHVVTDKLWLQENVLCLLKVVGRSARAGDVVEVRVRVSHGHAAEDDDERVAPQRSSRRERPRGDRDRSLRVYPLASDDALSTPSAPRVTRQLLVEVRDARSVVTDAEMESVFSPCPSLSPHVCKNHVALGWFCLAKRVAALQGRCGVLRPHPPESPGNVFWFSVPYQPDESVLDLLRADDEFDEQAALRGEEEETKAVASPAERDAPRGRENDDDVALTSVSLRDDPSASADAAQSSPSATSRPPRKAKAKVSVLMVDDSESILQSTASLLRRTGQYCVSTASSGAMAIAAVQAAQEKGSPIDVVAMDVQMPIMDGLTAMRSIRALFDGTDSSSSLSASSPPKIIAVSAYSDRETKEEALRAGADEFLCKPFEEKLFGEAVRHLLHKSRVLE